MSQMLTQTWKSSRSLWTECIPLKPSFLFIHIKANRGYIFCIWVSLPSWNKGNNQYTGGFFCRSLMFCWILSWPYQYTDGSMVHHFPDSELLKTCCPSTFAILQGSKHLQVTLLSLCVPSCSCFHFISSSSWFSYNWLRKIRNLGRWLRPRLTLWRLWLGLWGLWLWLWKIWWSVTKQSYHSVCM